MAIASDYQIPAIQPTPMETAGKNGSGKFAEGAVGHVCFGYFYGGPVRSMSFGYSVK
jgi:hypothetical protein